MIEENIMNEIVDIIQFHSAKNGVHWLYTIEYIKEKLLSERAATHKTDNKISKKQQCNCITKSIFGQ